MIYGFNLIIVAGFLVGAIIGLSVSGRLKLFDSPSGLVGQYVVFALIGGVLGGMLLATPVYLAFGGKTNASQQQAQVETTSTENIAYVSGSSDVESQQAVSDSEALQTDGASTSGSGTSSSENSGNKGLAGVHADADGETSGTEVETAASIPSEKKKDRVSTYEVVKADISWEDAYDDAKRKGGHLITITSPEEMRRAIELAESKELKYVWLGGYSHVNGDYVQAHWITDEPFSYSKWHEGEPSGVDEDGQFEKYLMMWYLNDEWTWNDQRNDPASAVNYMDGYLGYIIEYEE